MKSPRDDGAVAILVAVFATVIFAFLAILVDLGNARAIKQDAIGAADAAALAGAAELEDCTTTFPRRCPEATQAVKDVAAANFALGAGLDWASCSATPPAGWTWRSRQANSTNTNCIRYGYAPGHSTAGKPDVVFVAIPPRDSPVSFGGIVAGFSGVSVSAASVAGTANTSVAPCALCVQSQLKIAGQLSVAGGGTLYFGELEASSSGIANAAAGSYSTNDLPPSGALIWAPSPPTVTGQPVADPFSSTVAPPPSAPGPSGPVVDADCSTGSLPAGTYRGLTVGANDSCELEGVYEFRGDVRIDGNGKIFSGLSGASLYIASSGSLSVTSAALPALALTKDASTSFVLYGAGPMAITAAANLSGDVRAKVAVALGGGTGVNLVGDFSAEGAASLGLGGPMVIQGDVHAPEGPLTAGNLTVQGTVFADSFVMPGSIVTITDGGAGTPQPGSPDPALVR